MLVKTGLYSLVRHPSYTGFFVWAVGTQILLANPVSTVVFVGVLWRFFQQRIQSESQLGGQAKLSPRLVAHHPLFSFSSRR